MSDSQIPFIDSYPPGLSRLQHAGQIQLPFLSSHGRTTFLCIGSLSVYNKDTLRGASLSCSHYSRDVHMRDSSAKECQSEPELTLHTLLSNAFFFFGP